MIIVRSTWPLVGVVAIALALALSLSDATPAGAHAVLERSLPVQNQELAQPPERVEAWFSEPLERSLTELKVLDTEGRPVQRGPTLFSDDPTYAAVAVPPDLAPGIYTVSYQNVSSVDGHQWSGGFSFVVLLPDGTRPTGTAFHTPGGGQGFLPGIGDSTLRWFGLLAATALAGAMVFYLLVSRPAAGFLEEGEQRRVQDAAMALVADIAVMALPVLVLSLAGQLFLLADRLGGPQAIDDILFDTRTGQVWLSRLGISLALALLFAPALFSEAYRIGSRATMIVALALVGSLGLLMTYSLSSHADASGGAFWAVGSDFLHFLATGAWIGALLQLPLVFWWSRNRLDDSKRLLYLANVLDRFSWLAVISVALLLGSGTFNAFVQLPTLASLWDTTYGRVLIVKLGLIVPMLGMAAINGVFLKPALVDAIDALHEEQGTEQPSGDQRERFARRLQRVQRALPWTTVLEFALGAAVLISVAVLTQSTTADGELREKAGKPSGNFVTLGETKDLTAELLIEPFGLGLNTYTVTITPKPGQEQGEVLDVALIASYDDPNAPPSAGRSGTRQELTSTDQAGVWSAEAALLTQPGDWSVEMRIQRRSLDDERVVVGVQNVGGYLASPKTKKDLLDLPFTFVDWNVVAGGAMVVLGLGAFLIWRNRPPSWQRATANSVGLASLCGLIAGVVLIFGVDVHTPVLESDSPVPPSQESLVLGRQLFERNCMMCHGETGEGDGPAAAGLDVQPPRYVDHIPYHNDGTLFYWITNGIARDGVLNMPAWKEKLTETERWTLVTFLRQTWGSGSFEPVLPEDTPRTE